MGPARFRSSSRASSARRPPPRLRRPFIKHTDGNVWSILTTSCTASTAGTASANIAWTCACSRSGAARICFFGGSTARPDRGYAGNGSAEVEYAFARGARRAVMRTCNVLAARHKLENYLAARQRRASWPPTPAAQPGMTSTHGGCLGCGATPRRVDRRWEARLGFSARAIG